MSEKEARRERGEDESEATDGDEFLLQIVQMRAGVGQEPKKKSHSALAVGVSLDGGLEKKADCTTESETKSDDDGVEEAEKTKTKSEVAPLSSVEGNAERPIRVALHGSFPGAYSVEPDNSGRHSSVVEVEDSSVGQSEDPVPTVNDARLVGEADTVPRARVRPIRNQPSRDEEVGLPPVIEGVKEEHLEDPHQAKLLLWVGLICIFLLLVIIVILVLGFTGVMSPGDDDAGEILLVENITDMSGMTTLQRIQATGVLRCADVYLPNGFMYFDDRTGEKTGFYGELCKALAAAMSVKAVFVSPLPDVGYLEQVAIHDQNETVDINIVGYNKNMERVVNGGIQEGLSFSTPMLYGGLKLGGDQFHVTNCVDKGMKHIDECSSIKVCIDNATAAYDVFRDIMPTRFFVPTAADGMKSFEMLKQGKCNVMVQGMFQASRKNAAEQGVTNYSVSDGFFSKEPMALVTKPNDPEFADFVHSVLQALLVAEQHNITQATADTFPQTDLFGPLYKDMFRNAIAQAGNYGDLYARFLDEYIPRSGPNLLNNGTGLMYSLPLGDVEAARGDRPFGSIMQSILQRGILRCGIRTGRLGFAEVDGGSFSGMEIDLCKGLAYGLFQGKDNAVEFVQLVDAADGFGKLAAGDVDVVAGALWSIINDAKEPTTGNGYAFSPPYFYGYSEEEDNFALATRQDDHDWASFVFWTINALIYAEENNIDQANSILMPEQFLFGESLKRMLRDVVLSSGNFGEIYERHVEVYHPRGGRNSLNKIPGVGPQHYPLPGFFS